MVDLKGKLIVGQSGGTTSVINASLQGVIEQSFSEGGITGVLGMVEGVEGLLDGRVIDLTAEDAETIKGLSGTPASALGSCRYKLKPGDIQRLADSLRRLGVCYFVYIGGNDSADTAHQLAQHAGGEIRVMSVPKTIDNDLPFTDHCPGYGSTARFIALTTVDAGRDTESTRTIYPVKIIEVMGRNAGWLPAAAALAKRSEKDAPHLIYFPERPFEMKGFLDDVQGVYDRVGYCVVVVSENLRDAQGMPLAGENAITYVDSFGHAYSRGPAETLASLVQSDLGLRARYDKPGTIQRMAMCYQSKVDAVEAYLCGRDAVRQLMAGESDRMVTLVRADGAGYHCSTGLVELEKIANVERRLPAEYINDGGNFVTEGFLRYALPLIGELPPPYPRLRTERVTI
jgi:ATP-dependent phosphofructokinase / diphosphate-dependent phosphofructokinase